MCNVSESEISTAAGEPGLSKDKQVMSEEKDEDQMQILS